MTTGGALQRLRHVARRRPASVTSSTVYVDNAAVILSLRVDPFNSSSSILQIVTTLCPFLTDQEEEFEGVLHSNKSPAASLRVQPLTGGLSNQLWVVSSPNASVLVRVHPDCSKIVDREIENKVCAFLSRQRMAPKFYGRFVHGRVEEFYDNHVPLTWKDMPLYATEIARLMACLHQQEIPDDILPNEHATEGDIWYRITEWYEMARDLWDQESLELLDQMHQEWKWLRSVLELRPPHLTAAEQLCREVTVTHMDAQSLNLLRDPTGHHLKLIDFEYAGRNPRAVDIANTFCEFCDMNNLKADWEKEYPETETQNRFLRAYLRTLPMQNDPDEIFVATMRHCIGQYTLVSHLGWAIWAMVQEKLSDIEYDYVAYARHRMEGYQYFKRKYWK